MVRRAPLGTNGVDCTLNEGNMKTLFNYNDGGRARAGYKGYAGDCVCRAISIASERPYNEVYEALSQGNATQRRGKYEGSKAGRKSAANGINTNRKWFKEYSFFGFCVDSNHANRFWLQGSFKC